MNAWNLGFQTGSFDLAISGFMGWYDCFNFTQGEFTQSDTKSREICRVLRDGGKFVCCSWEEQEDLRFMEEAMIRHYPAILHDSEYIEQHPIGMAYEKPAGYEIILRQAGFREIEVRGESMTFVSTDEEEWWRQMQRLGWKSLLDRIELIDANQFTRMKEAIFKDLQSCKQEDGLHFTKSVFYVKGIK
ncbi:MAG: hypothetical protein C3F13_16000 [Anaerolineales bacterium]|nr:MAG: hypothetical protein C3F13_16000 [Anaerolineales bacterium]